MASCKGKTMPFLLVIFMLLYPAGAFAQSDVPPGLLDRIDGLEREIRTLTGQNEKLQFRLDQLEKNLQNAEKEKAAQLAPKAEGLPASPVAPPVPATPDSQLNSTSTELYNDAFSKLRAQDYAGAEAGFSQFLQRFPKDALAGNAQYWLGETFYVRSDFNRAVEEFLKSYRQFPKGSKAPDSLLKLGLSLTAIGSKDDACKSYSRLAKEYADAPAAIKQRAASEAQKLSCK
jgi:tol-pal system protein YbgF